MISGRSALKPLIALAILMFSVTSFAQMTLPTVSLGFKNTENPAEVVNVIKIILMMTVLTLAPAILIMMTGFTRILIVLSFMRKPWEFNSFRRISY